MVVAKLLEKRQSEIEAEVSMAAFPRGLVEGRPLGRPRGVGSVFCLKRECVLGLVFWPRVSHSDSTGRVPFPQQTTLATDRTGRSLVRLEPV